MSFKVARLKSGHSPKVVQRPIAANASWPQGTPLVITAGNFVKAGADPASVAAIALTPAGADTTGLVRTARLEFPPGTMQGVAVQDEQEFLAEYVGNLPANSGGTFGITEGADGKWRVDFAKTGADARVRYMRSMEADLDGKPLVLVHFLAANVSSI